MKHAVIIFCSLTFLALGMAGCSTQSPVYSGELFWYDTIPYDSVPHRERGAIVPEPLKHVTQEERDAVRRATTRSIDRQ